MGKQLAVHHLRHAGSIKRLVVGELPPELTRIKKAARRYRQALEQAVAEANGGNVSLVAAHVIDAAVGHELHRAIAQWVLINRFKGMTTSDILTCSKTIAAARDARNRCVEQLRLEQDARGLIQALYSGPFEDEDAEGPDDSQDASDASRTQDTSTPAAGGGDGGEGLSQHAAETEDQQHEGTQD